MIDKILDLQARHFLRYGRDPQYVVVDHEEFVEWRVSLPSLSVAADLTRMLFGMEVRLGRSILVGHSVTIGGATYEYETS